MLATFYATGLRVVARVEENSFPFEFDQRGVSPVWLEGCILPKGIIQNSRAVLRRARR